MVHNMLSFSALDLQFNFKGTILEFVYPESLFSTVLGNSFKTVASYKFLIIESRKKQSNFPLEKISTLKTANKVMYFFG